MKTIFISCGQFTPAEKNLGRQIAEMVRARTNLEPFFADEVQDLNGLDANILSALRDCVAFITVMHPRGEITRPDGSVLNRASVWIEQEIAIAAYMRRIEGRPIEIIAFAHNSVGLEGLRQLLQLNPIKFADDSEVLAELSRRLEQWKFLKPSNIELLLGSKFARIQDGHRIRILEIGLVNETNQPIEKYEFEVSLPVGILKHWSRTYPTEVRHNVPAGRRCFRFDQVGRGTVRPHDQLHQPLTIDYCIDCGIPAHEDNLIGAALAADMTVSARAWINGNEFVAEKTIKQLAVEAERA
jgi:hypothetical protein